MDSVNIDAATEEWLDKAGYIIGQLQRVIFFAEGVKETNWSATRPVVGVDGVERRWVYLHYFKDGQPSINWLDPSFAGMRMVMGDALHSLTDLGTGALRLDANGFLGVEKSAAEGSPAWSEGHPLSEAANHLIASMVRKVGGFTFQELNLTIDDIRDDGEAGADLSYDFINRPAYQHALATGDTEFLRLTLRTSMELGVDPASLIHALQNHDELTYELVHWSTGHRDDVFHLQGRRAHRRRDWGVGPPGPARPAHRSQGALQPGVHDQRHRLHHRDRRRRGPRHHRPRRHRRRHRPDPPRSPTAGHVQRAATRGVRPVRLGHVRHVDVAANEVAELLRGGDTRWIHRAGHDLMGVNESATRSMAGMPRGRSLYGSIPSQLGDETSFLRQLQAILRVRSHYGIATSRQVDIPEVSHKGMLVLVHQLEDPNQHQLTLLNFADEDIAGSVRSEHLPPGSHVMDMFTGKTVGTIDDLHSFAVEMPRHHGMSLLVETVEEVASA